MEQKEISVKYDLGGIEIKLTPAIVKEYVLGNKNADITMQEFKMFTEICRSRKLNPFIKGEVHLIKYGNNPATIVVGKDAILKRATLHPKFNGFKSGVIVQTSNGEIVNRNGCFKLDSDILIGSWCEVFRKDWENSIFTSCSFSEIKQDKNPAWQKQPCVMAEKVAIVRGLRTSFPEDLGGLYEQDEISKPVEQSGFTEEDLKSEEPNFEDVIEVEPTTGEVKSNKISLEDL
jgi:phage recombination protein Bet